MSTIAWLSLNITMTNVIKNNFAIAIYGYIWIQHALDSVRLYILYAYSDDLCHKTRS